MIDANDDHPAWWRENDRLRAEIGLPEYEPPRFADGTHTHEVTERLESEHDCRIQFVGVNTTYPDDWEVRVDGEAVFEIGRHRDESSNTVYEMGAGTFRETLESYLKS